MKVPFLMVCLLALTRLYAQTSAYDSTVDYLTQTGTKLNTVHPPPGFTVYYNCDSLLFMRGNFGDTIKIWTSGIDWYESPQEFACTLKNENFGVTQFAKIVDKDGRIYVSTYHQTEFIFRHDSLFEIQDASHTPTEPFARLFKAYMDNQIDETTYKFQLDSLQQAEKKQAIYTPKLIFAKTMFTKNRTKIKLSKKLNFQQDVILLEHQWVQSGKACYTIRINNKEDGNETSYSYSFNEDMKFVFWEGCRPEATQ